MKNPTKARPFGSFCRIVEFIPSSDGLVRSVKVFRKGNIVTTSISNLYPLELESSLESNDRVDSLACSEKSLDSENDVNALNEETFADICPEENLTLECDTNAICSDLTAEDTPNRPVHRSAVKCREHLQNLIKSGSL